MNLILGDCYSELKNLPKNSVDLILIDPPYNISRNTNFNKGGGNESKYGKLVMDFGEWDSIKYNFNDLFIEFYRILKPGGTFIMFYDIFKMQDIYNLGLKCKFKQPRIGIWNKTNAVPVNAKINYLSNCREYFISFCKGKKGVFNSYYDKALYSYPIVSGKIRIHSTQKPVKLLEDLIKVNSNENGVVLDCFMGSGSTGIACLNTNRDFIGIEIDENYFNKAKQWLNNHKQLNILNSK